MSHSISLHSHMQTRFQLRSTLQYGMKSLSKFAIAFPRPLLRSILRHIISLTPHHHPPVTARASDWALAVDYLCVVSGATIVLQMARMIQTTI